ncbi:MAG: transcription elongation factor GreB [Pseudohongiella sp.]|uniref:transcription elongation factor GreB n=1 Tax=Pseudohongiella sp. TaxID=1979412 RepID=UPI0034A04B6E
MSRYRPPAPPKSNYLTAEGESRMRQELDFLWRDERPKVTQQVSEAAALGDRSENAEYIYGKKRLREIDRRVRYLRKRLEDATVVTTLPSDISKIYFGAWVDLEDSNDNVHEYRIVGPDEVGDKPGYVSMDAPLGRALLGKQVDDEVSIVTPAGRSRYTVVAIRYTMPA